jgi:predicted transcriptional regulator
MLTNYERVIKRFKPAFRIKAARMMVKEYGIKQQQIAKMLGVSQAAVSKFLKSDPNKYEEITIDSKSIKEFVEKMNNNDKRNAQKVVCAACQSNKKFDCTFMVK